MEPLKIVTVFDPPFVSPCVLKLKQLQRTSWCPNLGPTAESLAYTMDMLNVNYTLIPNVNNFQQVKKSCLVTKLTTRVYWVTYTMEGLI